MTFKRICSVLLAGVIFSCNIAANTVFGVGSVCAEEIQTSDEVSAEVLPIAEFDSEDGMITVLDEYLPCTMVDSNVRMFENTMKVSAFADGEQSYFVKRDFTWDFASEEYSEYDYLNFWVYIPEQLPTNAEGTPSDLCVMLRTRENSNIKAYYALVPMEQSGWQLISIERESFLNRSANATWADTSEIKELVVFTNVEENIVSGASAWSADGSGYILMDYMYLSKSILGTAFNITSSSIEDGAVNVPENIDGNKAVSITAEREIFGGNIHTDEIELSVNGEVISEGFNIAIDSEDSSKINITFDESLNLSSEYSITVNPGSIFDEYGNTLERPYTISFTTTSYTSVYEVNGTTIENGATEVAVDLGGYLVYEITMSNPPSSPEELQSGVSVLMNGTKLQDGYSVSFDDKTIVITMDEELEYNSQYTIELANSLKDAAGNVISGNRSFSFTTETKVLDVVDILAMDDESSYSKSLNDKITLTQENTNIYDKALRVEIPAALTPSDTVQLKRNYSSSAPLNASEYSYLNYWIYSEKKTESGLNFLCFTSGGNYRHHLPLDWSGWKLVSIPLSGFYVLSNTPTWEKVTEVRIDANSYTGYITPWAEGGYILVDRIFLSKELPASFNYEGNSLPQDYSNAPVKDFEVGFTYTDEVSAVDADAVSVVKDGSEQFIPADVTVDGSQVTVKISEKLEYNTKYNITINNDVFDEVGQRSATTVSYSFTTASESISVGQPVFSSKIPAVGKNITVTSDAVNDTEKAQSVVLTVVQYDSSGAVLDILDTQKTVNAGEEAQIGADITVKEAASVIRAFVCDNAQDRNLLRTDYSVIGTEEETEQNNFDSSLAQESLALNEPELDIDKLNISGTYNGAGIILVRATSPDDTDVLLVPVYASSDEKYDYLYTFADTLESGTYNVEVSVFGGASQTSKISYLDAEDRTNALQTVNESGDVKSLLSNNKEYFGVSELNDTQLGSVAKTLIEQKPYSSFDEILSMVDTAMSVLEELNSTAWGGMNALLEKHYDIILHGNDDYSYYSSLTTAKRNEINREIEKDMPVNSFEAFRTIFSREVEEYKANSSSGGSSGGGGGGGGGGSSSTVQNSTTDLKVGITAPLVPATSPVVEQKPTEGTDAEPVFNDINDYSWAESSIEMLYDMNVISASEDRRFRPGDNITREEFVKMLVMALGIAPEDTDSGFMDTTDGAWYQPYLSAAKNAGITAGKSDGTFGVGEHITRQDMSAMAYRAVKTLNKEIAASAEPIEFADKDEISEYAVEAVETMQTAGVLSGMEDGKFCPLLYAQRAQAAKVIAGLIEALK